MSCQYGTSIDPGLKSNEEQLENSVDQYSNNNQDISKHIGSFKAAQDEVVLDDLSLMLANSEAYQRLKNIEYKVIEKVRTTHSFL